ncbi:hypothetical protein KW841_06550 [Pseudomonas sp. PDM28]|uniref:hypothetical protein n=1 Tax=Pseudomonas sp. PDM28 TaxID=2854770 RepID=UPI001C46123E|nr:hypothetical protein [Pseudomonas sp. PDM28]MBV7552008.1 hypothetical protein [Pseudomonas sp. PDM28]
MPIRLSVLDPIDFKYLSADDKCFHYGEYTAGGGYGASDTNQQIHNLKKSPNSPEAQLRWKRRAVVYWGEAILNSNLKLDVCSTEVTFIPLPCSKPIGHPEYDDRMVQVLSYIAQKQPGLDIRQVLVQAQPRDAQHFGCRSTPEGLAETLQIDQSCLVQPLRPIVLVVDDVITRGASFAAAKKLLTALPGVQSVQGLFLAKTIHPPIEWPQDDDSDAL